jgi:subtilase family serine protease
VQIPAAFSGVVAGPVKLNDFHSRPPQAASKVVPQYTSASGAHYLVPADYGVIYDLNSVYTNGYTGTAQSIAVVGRSDVLATDISAFRSNYGLAANPITTIIANGTDPGVTNDSNTLEGTLDVEWAGAIAPNASIQYVVAASTATTDGVDLAAQYVVNNKVAPILSVSYGTCEAQANNSFYSTLWEQAAVEGISVIVAAGGQRSGRM